MIGEENWGTGVLKTDLHLHTSEDPADVIEHDAHALIERAAELGYGALAITLHDRQLSDARVFDHARDCGITLIPGVERTIEGRHVLLLNFPPAAAESVTTFADIAALKEQRPNGAIVAPHPFFPDATCLRSELERQADLFDAVEWSYFWTQGLNFNARAAKWAAGHGKTMLGNSDLHDLRQLGRTYSLVCAESGADAICHAIRQGHVSVWTSPAPKMELARIVGGMLRRGRKPAPARKSVRVFAGASPS
jgi:predicted metal-dependent phosphoesterase TrpH